MSRSFLVRNWSHLMMLACTLCSIAPKAAGEGKDSKASLYIETPKAIGEKSMFIVGDSIMGGIAPQLKRELRLMGTKTQPVILWKISTGLGRPDYFNWPNAAKELTKEQLDYGVALFGTNDVKALNQGGKYIKYDTEEFWKIYSERVAEIGDILCSRAKKVFWLALPPMRKKVLHDGSLKLNEVYRNFAQTKPCIEFVSLTELVGNEQGAYTKYKTILGKQTNMRASDGIHLSSKAGNWVARYVLELIRRDAGPSEKM